MEMKELVELAKRLHENKKETPKYVKMNPLYYYTLVAEEKIKVSAIDTAESRLFGLKFVFDETVEAYEFVYEEEE